MKWISDWSKITLGLRATSVSGVPGTTSIKYVASPSTPTPPDVTPPAAPSIDVLAVSDTGSSDTDDISSIKTPDVEVTLPTTGSLAAAGDVVKLYSGTTLVGSFTLTAVEIGAGKVTITTSDLGSDGIKALTATITDPAGNASSLSNTINYTLDTTSPTLPTILVDDVTVDNAVDPSEFGGNISITGSTTNAQPGDIVTLTINGKAFTGVVGVGGTFSIDVPGSDLAADPDVTIGASVTTLDVAGNSATGTNSKLYSVVLPDYITVGRDGMWFDTNEDGQLNGNETLITALNDTDGDGYSKITDPLFTDFATGDYTVRFVDAKTPYPLDLTGFGAGDKIIIDGKTNAASWYGVEATIRSLAGIPSSVPTGRIYQTYSKLGNTSSDFGIYKANKSAGGYIYNTSGAFAYKAKNGASGTFAFGSPAYYAYLSLLGSKVFGAASTNTKPIPLAKGLPTSDPWPGYALEVIMPSGTIVTA